MARIGMRYPKYSVVTVTEDASGNETESYGAVKVMGKAISASATVNFAEADLWADDGKAESVREFSDGTLTVYVDDIENAALADLTGATLDATSGGLDYGTEDNAPYVRWGYIRRRMRHGAITYGGIVYKRVKFSAPNEEDATKGESIAFGTPTMTGDILRAADGKWKESSAWLETEAAAITWLDAHIRPTPSGTGT